MDLCFEAIGYISCPGFIPILLSLTSLFPFASARDTPALAMYLRMPCLYIRFCICQACNKGVGPCRSREPTVDSMGTFRHPQAQVGCGVKVQDNCISDSSPEQKLEKAASFHQFRWESRYSRRGRLATQTDDEIDEKRYKFKVAP
jgi:hypothetical protein